MFLRNCNARFAIKYLAGHCILCVLSRNLRSVKRMHYQCGLYFLQSFSLLQQTIFCSWRPPAQSHFRELRSPVMTMMAYRACTFSAFDPNLFPMDRQCCDKSVSERSGILLDRNENNHLTLTSVVLLQDIPCRYSKCAEMAILLRFCVDFILAAMKYPVYDQ